MRYLFVSSDDVEITEISSTNEVDRMQVSPLADCRNEEENNMNEEMIHQSSIKEFNQKQQQERLNEGNLFYYSYNFFILILYSLTIIF